MLRASDYPTGNVDEQGRSDLYDEAPEPFLKALNAAGLAPSRGAFTRSFHISKTYYGSIESFGRPRVATTRFLLLP